MKLTTFLVLGAAGLAATAATIWLAANPARPAAASMRASVPAPRDQPPPLPPAPPAVDRSHFQAGTTLRVEGRVGHQVVPAATASETFLYVDVTAGAAGPARPAPLDLSIVIDRSGSMKGKRLANAMAATRAAIERLADGDVVSVVAYDTRADVLVPATTIDGASRARILDELARPRAGGDTCISCGLDTALHLLGRRPGTISRILLLSDGLATAGVRDLDGFHRIADDVRRLGASITTIGVDVGYDERIMAALARDSNGLHYFVPRAADLPAVLDRELAALTRTVAHGAELIVELAPGVTALQVYDRVSAASGSQVQVPLGAFAAGDHKTALLRLRLPPGPAGERQVASVRLRYDDLLGAGAGAADGVLAVRASDDATTVGALDGAVSARVSASESAAALVTANGLFRAGRAAEASQVVRQQNVRLEAEHARARRNADPARLPALDSAFVRQKAALADADLGFLPVTATAASAPATTPLAGAPPADTLDEQRRGAGAERAGHPGRGGEAQTRANQAEAFRLEE